MESSPVVTPMSPMVLPKKGTERMFESIVLTVAATAGNNIGKILQKKGTVILPPLSFKFKVIRAYALNKTWLIGFLMDIFGALLMLRALALAPVIKFIEYDSSFSEKEKKNTKALKVVYNLNNAACKLKLKDYKHAAKLCTKIISRALMLR